MAPSLAAPRDRFGEQIAVTAVEVPVRVLVDGKPLRGLKAGDFELLDRGVPQQITGFEVVDLSLAAPAEAPPEGPDGLAGAPAGRRLLVLFDLANSRRSFLVRAARGVRRMVGEQVHPADRMAVALYSGNAGVELLTGFTRDPETLRLALDAVEALLDADRRALRAAQAALTEHSGRATTTRGVDGPDAELDTAQPGGAGSAAAANPRLREFTRLASALGTTAALVLQGASTARPGGAAVGGLTLPDFGGRGSQRVTASPTVTGDPVRALLEPGDPGALAGGLGAGPEISAVRAFSLALQELVTLLRDLGGQKQMVLLSEGFATPLMTDAAVLNHLGRMLEAFRRSGWTLNAIDVEGIPSIDRPTFDAEALFYMANESGGELFENFNRIGGATKRLMERTSISYVLTFQPPDLAWDGRYHEIEVRLRNGPRGARLLHRPGYHAPLPPERRSGLERRVDAAELLLGDERVAEIETAVLATALPATGGLARVPLVVEVAGADLLAGGRKSRRGVEIQAFALDPAGGVADLQLTGVDLDLDRWERTLERGGLRFVGELELPAGDYTLRVLVRNVESGRLYLGGTPLRVADATAGAPHLQPPLFLESERGNWVLVRRTARRGPDDLLGLGPRTPPDGPPAATRVARDGSAGEASAPRSGADEAGRVGRDDGPLVPVARPVLAPGATAVVLVLGTHLESGAVLESRVLDAGGRPAPAAQLELVERLAAGADRVERLVGRLSTDGLAAGDYRLEVSVRTPGAPPVVSSADFRIVEPARSSGA